MLKPTLLSIAILMALLLPGNPSQDTAPYAPLGMLPDKVWPHEGPGTLSGDFKRAILSETRTAAQAGWEAFLRDHDTGEYEDGFHLHHVRAAKYELARIYYVSGQIELGDRLLLDLMRSE